MIVWVIFDIFDNSGIMVCLWGIVILKFWMLIVENLVIVVFKFFGLIEKGRYI